ncbi:peptidase S15 [Fusarium mexicanum]|uniref:Peptidase S15 n=1 Tax=Fusarium mexicanum TaxID=751941 RepID=A0A8H5I734_9HYPO|nr:peptidase S15 [Fusarium mexicanum]
MSSVHLRHDIEFPTLDGITLRGWLYPATKRGPGMILSPGFNMPKDAIIPDICKWFQERDITCLAWDPRGIGSSDGEPRNDIDPRQEAEHLHDAVTWLSKNPLIDATKIALWGLCFGGNVTLAAAALDKRVAAMISVAPLIDSTGLPERRQPILELAMYDRADRLKGDDPMYLPYVNEDGSVPNGLQLAADMMPALDRLGIPVENRVTVQTYYRALTWSVLNLVEYIAPTPAMMVTPEFDVSCPTKDQLKAYECMGEPKELDVLKGKGHLDWIFGDVDIILNRQLDFLKRNMVF